MHIETIAWQATQPNTGAAATAAPAASGAVGNTLVVKNAKSAALLLALWAHNQVDGWHQLTYPTAHDTTRGLRVAVEALSVVPRTPLGLAQVVQPQETLTFQIAGSNTSGDVETGVALAYYKDLPGVQSRLLDFPSLQRRMQSMLTIQATVTGTAAGWSGPELITAESDLLRANRDYAVLGIQVNTRCAAIGIFGPDTGYQVPSVPGEPSQGDLMSQWFPTLARMFDMPLIPVINSGNKSATYLQVLDNENAGAIVCSVTLGLLD